MRQDVRDVAEKIRRTFGSISAGSEGTGIVFIEKRLYDELLADAKILANFLMENDNGK